MDIVLMMLLPFIIFGAFAAIGVAMVVYFEQERGLRFIGYCVAIAFGGVALVLPVAVFLSLTGECYDSRGLRVSCDGGDVIILVNPDEGPGGQFHIPAPTFDRIECYKDDIRVQCWPSQRVR